jgi:hypothetical protein
VLGRAVANLVGFRLSVPQLLDELIQEQGYSVIDLRLGTRVPFQTLLDCWREPPAQTASPPRAIARSPLAASMLTR